MTAVVKAESLTKRFGELSAVTDLSFALEARHDHGLFSARTALEAAGRAVGQPKRRLQHVDNPLVQTEANGSQLAGVDSAGRPGVA
jgi:hypothetical protein